MKRALTAAVLSLLFVTPNCAEDPRRTQARAAIERTLDWLRAHPPEQDARLAVLGMDIWTWNLVSRLHPDRSVREEAASVTRERLSRVAPPRAPEWIALSWWAVILRCAQSQRLDAQPLIDGLVASDLDRLLEDSAPTTAWWSSQLLRHAGLEVESRRERTAIAAGLAKGAGYRPSARDASAFYHELAAAADFGRGSLAAFDEAHIDFARRAQPELVALSQHNQNTDAVATLVVAGALLGQRDEPYFEAAIDWLLERQLEDGTYRRQFPSKATSDIRHAVLVVTWALMVYLSDA